jgi:hypothetical protein
MSHSFGFADPYLNMLVASSRLARPARMAAAIARVRPAAPRTSASGLATFSSPRQEFNAVDGVGAESHVRGVGAPGEVALVRDHGVLGAGPAEARDHAVGQLIGEKVRGNSATPGWPRQAGDADRPVAGRGHPTDPDPAQIVGAPIPFHFEMCHNLGVIEPGPPAVLRNPDGFRLTDQD